MNWFTALKGAKWLWGKKREWGETRDPINPDHYKSPSGLEAIDVIEAFDLGYCKGSAMKYILRAGKKDDEAQDIRKAIWFLERRIKEVE